MGGSASILYPVPAANTGAECNSEELFNTAKKYSETLVKRDDSIKTLNATISTMDKIIMDLNKTIQQKDSEIKLVNTNRDTAFKNLEDTNKDLTATRAREQSLSEELKVCSDNLNTCATDLNTYNATKSKTDNDLKTAKSIIAGHVLIRNILYIVIAALVVVIIGLGIWIFKLRKGSSKSSTMSGGYDPNDYAGDIYEDYE